MATDCPWSSADVEAFARGEPSAYSPPLPADEPTADDLEAFRTARRVGYLTEGPEGGSFPAYRLWWDWCWSAGHPFVAVRWRSAGRRVEADLTHFGDLDQFQFQPAPGHGAGGNPCSTPGRPARGEAQQAGALELQQLLTAAALPGLAIDTGPTLWAATVPTADADLVAAQVVDLLLERSG